LALLIAFYMKSGNRLIIKMESDDYFELLVTVLGRVILGGYCFSNNFVVTTIRTLVFLGLIATYYIASYKNDWTVNSSLLFSGIISLFLFIVSLTLFILNKLLDRTFEISSDSFKEVNNNGKPEEVSDRLWKTRMAYSYESIVSGDAALELIQSGFSTDEVFILIQELKKRPQLHESPKRKDSDVSVEDYLTCCGSVYQFPFNRQQINSVFPQNNRFSYVLVSTLMAFLMTFTVSQSYKFFYGHGIFMFSLIAGISAYSLLHPPEVDPYSFAQNDIYVGITRPFWVFMLCSIMLIVDKLKNTYGPTTNVPEFSISLDWLSFQESTFIISRLIILFLPILMFFIIIPADMTITVILESISRYLFSNSGSSGIINSIVVFLKSSVVALGIGITIEKYSFSNKYEIVYAVSTFVLLIPISFSLLSKTEFLKIIIVNIVFSAISFLTVYFVNRSKFDIDTLQIIAICITIIFEIIIPCLSVYTQYLLLSLKFINTESSAFSYIRRFWMAFAIPFISYTIIYTNSTPYYLISLIIVSTINRGFCEPNLFGFSVIIYRITLLDEFQWSNKSAALFISYIITKKMFNVYYITEAFIKSRTWITSQIADHDVEYSAENSILCFITAILSDIIPFVDRSFSFASYIWSLITNAPSFYPASFEAFHSFLPPRPNCFWNVNIEQSADIAKNIASRISDYPIEAPIYTSSFRALSQKLGRLISEGKFGIVNENNMYLLMGGKLSAFIHIISLEHNCVRFQLRGLEYSAETYCHQVELRAINDITSESHDSSYCILSTMMNMLTVWRLVNDKLDLSMYDLSSTELVTLINTTQVEDINGWMLYIVAYFVSINSSILNSIIDYPRGINNTYFKEALSFFGCTLDEESYSKAYAVYLAFNESLFPSREVLPSRLMVFFQGNPIFHENHLWCESLDFLINNVYIPSSRVMVLALYLQQAGLTSRPAADDDTKYFLETYENDYLASPLKGQAFSREFQKEQKKLLSIEECNGSIQVLFFYKTSTEWRVISVQKQTVRSLWASEAYQQIVYLVDEDERPSIQSHAHHLHNLINQSCDLPIGYPAMVSPILSSYI